MASRFPINRDYDVYVWLKSSLPAGYRIQAEPRTEYYSEWLFSYNLYQGEVLRHTFAGDYREIAPGSLVKEAQALLQVLEKGS